MGGSWTLGSPGPVQWKLGKSFIHSFVHSFLKADFPDEGLNPRGPLGPSSWPDGLWGKAGPRGRKPLTSRLRGGRAQQRLRFWGGRRGSAWVPLSPAAAGESASFRVSEQKQGRQGPRGAARSPTPTSPTPGTGRRTGSRDPGFTRRPHLSGWKAFCSHKNSFHNHTAKLHFWEEKKKKQGSKYSLMLPVSSLGFWKQIRTCT